MEEHSKKGGEKKATSRHTSYGPATFEMENYQISDDVALEGNY